MDLKRESIVNSDFNVSHELRVILDSERDIHSSFKSIYFAEIEVTSALYIAADPKNRSSNLCYNDSSYIFAWPD